MNGVAIGGRLIVTDTVIYFKPHALNFGDLSEKYLNIVDVGGYSKGILTFFSIWTNSGYEIKLNVWKKNEIIQEIESRRRAVFASMGMEVPALRYGSIKI